MMAMNNDIFNRYVMEGDKPVLVDFWAPWCVYCRRIAPALEKIAEQYQDGLDVGKVNIDEEPQLAEQERIETIPTLILYHQGQVLGSIVAPDSKARIEKFLRDHLER